MTTEQILQMSREGVPPADIIQKMRDAGTVYRLSGSQLARLQSQGVPDEVLDYMQATYLAQERARGAEYAYGPFLWGPYPYGYWGPPGYWWPYWGYYPPYAVPPPHRRPPPRPPGAQPPAPAASGGQPAPAPVPPAATPPRAVPGVTRQQRN